jgi:hypothetical protein
MKRLHSQALVLLVGVITALVSYFTSGRVEGAILFNFGVIAAIVGLLLIIFDVLLWKLPLLYPWFVDIPNLNGSWKVTARILQPGAAKAESDQGEASIEQSHSGIYMSIIWGDKSETEFFEAAPLAVSGTRTKRCALSSFYQFKKKGTERVTRSAAMAFDVPAKLFKNRPDRFTIFYTTTDGYRGEIELSK